MEENEKRIGYKKLIAWQKADELAFQIYRPTKNFPPDEKIARSEVGRLLNSPTTATRKKALGAKDFLLFSLTSCFLFLVLGLFFPASFAFAATLYFNPSSGNFTVGNILTTSVLVNTQGESINNSDAVINFPTDLLEVVSVSKSGSIFSLWVEEPAFSNSAGTISFNGGLPTPGFNGAAGEIINIVFRVKKAGSASVIFSSAAVRANDGYGTDILKNKAQAQFNLISSAELSPPIVSPPITAGVPAAPEISSPTHPDPNKWYALKDAKFTWPLSSDITGSRLLVGRIPTAVPTITYIPPISSREVTDLEDGIWYFSVQLRNSAGWGAISRFRFQIDTERPERFEIIKVRRDDLTEPRAKFIFDASDKTSGIDYYEVRINNEDPQVWRDDGSHTYETSNLQPGKYILLAKAIDKTGNSLSNSVEFTIEALESPIITEYPKELQSGEILIIKGKTKYPDAQINIWLRHEKDEAKIYSVKSDKDGKFTFVADDRLSSGIYTAWAEVTDARGAKSNPGEKVTILVGQAAFIRIGSWAVGFLAVTVPLIALILLLVYFLYHWWHKFMTLRKRVRKEIREAEQALHKAFDLLKEAIREQIKMLEKTKSRRQLTEEEEKIIKQLKRDLDDAEKFVRKEIEDVEKEVM
jgi:hypothetical protein